MAHHAKEPPSVELELFSGVHPKLNCLALDIVLPSDSYPWGPRGHFPLQLLRITMAKVGLMQIHVTNILPHGI